MTSKQVPLPTLLLHDARVVLLDRVVPASLLVRNGCITAIILPGSTLPAADIELSLSGLTLFPGFIDLHIHGAVGIDVLTANAEELIRVSEFLARNGVTAWLPTLVPAAQEQYRNAAHAIQDVITRQAQWPAIDEGGKLSTWARALGMHYEGPFVNTHQCGALHTDYFQTFSGTELDSLPLPAPASAKLITVAPEIEGGIDLVRELRSRGWIISIGHTRADAALLEQAQKAGAQHMTHFMNAMAPLHHRSPGPIAWGLARDDVTCDMIADGVHLDPFVLRLLVKLKGRDRLVLISDAIAAAGMGDGEYQIWGEKITVANGRTSNARGSIAGSVITMLEAVKMMLSLGVSEVDVARMAASNPARLLGIGEQCGSIEEEKQADVVALDASGNVVLTVIGGVIAYQA